MTSTFPNPSTTIGSSDGSAPPAQPAAATPQQVRLELDDSQVEAAYANLCFVSSTADVDGVSKRRRRRTG